MGTSEDVGNTHQRKLDVLIYRHLFTQIEHLFYQIINCILDKNMMRFILGLDWCREG
jgi:hypothetical protein